MDSLILQGIRPHGQVGVKASDAQQNLVRRRNQLGSTTCQTGKNLDSNVGLPQEAEGETDHLPETTSNCLLE
jgi:hypothetical protein